MNDITKVVDKIIEALDSRKWSEADRLQKVLEELVKVEVASLEAAKL